MRIDAQPGGQPDGPVSDFNLAGIGAARRLPYSVGRQADASTRATHGTLAIHVQSQFIRGPLLLIALHMIEPTKVIR